MIDSFEKILGNPPFVTIWKAVLLVIHEEDARFDLLFLFPIQVLEVRDLKRELIEKRNLEVIDFLKKIRKGEKKDADWKIS